MEIDFISSNTKEETRKKKRKENYRPTMYDEFEFITFECYSLHSKMSTLENDEHSGHLSSMQIHHYDYNVRAVVNMAICCYYLIPIPICIGT